MSVLLEFSMTPLDKGESVGRYVARSLEIISTSGLPYRLNPMGTVIEGDWDDCLDVVRRCYERMSADCNRITCSVKIDYRKGKSGRIASKVARIESLLGKSLDQ
ncbi:MAG: MTH1187 family thiamine-binding protein [bacterium]|nr:MTH1187 family thiamine-binding protein [bacterium]